MPLFEQDGARLHYQMHPSQAQDGSLVTFLHGLGSCGEDWLLQVPVVARRHPILTLDLPGHGRSDALRGRPTTPAMARSVAGLLRELGAAPTHLVGLSLGGAVALQLAADEPRLVRSLIAVNTFARLRMGAGGMGRGLARLALLGMGRMDWLGRWVAAGLFPRTEQEGMRRAAAERLASNPRSAYWRAILAAARFDLRSRLGQIAVPVLIIAGEDDTTVPLAAKVELAASIPSARLEIIPGSGHATPIDAHERFNALLLAFMEQVERDAQGRQLEIGDWRLLDC